MAALLELEPAARPIPSLLVDLDDKRGLKGTLGEGVGVGRKGVALEPGVL